MKHTCRVLVLLIAGAVSAQAEGFPSNTVGGAAIGAAAGAVIGNNTGGQHTGRGAAIGAVAGALIGLAIDQQSGSRRYQYPEPARCSSQPEVVYVQPAPVYQYPVYQQVVLPPNPVIIYQQVQPNVIYVNSYSQPVVYCQPSYGSYYGRPRYNSYRR